MSDIAQHILAALNGTQITPLERDLILKEKILGFTLFKRNIESAAQLAELTCELKTLARQAAYELILAVDQEGGRVFRLPEPFSKIPPMRWWGDLFEKTGAVKPLFELGRILGSEVITAGFDLDFAPVVDVDGHADNPVIADRSFSKSPQVVYKLARQVIRGLITENVIPCLKHFPGHGATTQDSHEVLPQDNRDLSQLEETDLFPFKQLIAEQLAPTIMTAHVVYPKVDADAPATLSKKWLNDILRKKLNFNGVLFSDDLLMNAIKNNYKIDKAALRFFECGGDVALIGNEPEKTLEVIRKLRNNKALASRLQASAQRIKNLKQNFPEHKKSHVPLENVIEKNTRVLERLVSLPETRRLP